MKHTLGLSERQIARSVGIGHSTVDAYLKRAVQAGLEWKEAEKLSDTEVEARLFQQVGRNEPAARAPIDLAWVHMDLRRAGVTLELLWTEYQQAVADGGSGQKAYQYSQFCELYGEYKKKQSPVMRQTHRAGEKGFVDFSGKKPRIIDSATGESIEVELFVLVLGASNYTYAEATRTQRLADFVSATVHALEYFGGVPEMLVPDQLKSAVSKTDRSEPEINVTYAEMAQHYSTAIVPARPRKPKDKAKVEVGVQIAQRWILACLRNHRFFSLQELNAAIRGLLEKLNTRPFQKLEGCRRSAFEKLDHPAMRPLPARRYEIGEWKLHVGVNIDHHVEFDHRYYSVPCELITAKVDVRATATIVEVWRDRVRVTSHERSYGPKGTAVTRPEHRPRAHREWGDWPPERLVGWAQTKGAKTADVAAAILTRGPHPESGRRACLGLMRLGGRYGDARLEAACARALAIGSPTQRSVKAILKSGLEKSALAEEVEATRVVHENIRGGDYFARGEMEPTNKCDMIEARYLEEERISIILDSNTEPSREPPRGARGVQERREVSGGVTLGGARSSADMATMPALPALIGRLQAAWTRAPMRLQSALGTSDERAGDDSLPDERDSSSCTSQTACFSIGKNKGEPRRAEEEEEGDQQRSGDETKGETDRAGSVSQ